MWRLRPVFLAGQGLVGDDAAQPPMEQWPKSAVAGWLQQLKQDEELEFDVARLACSGELFTAMTKEEMKETAGVPAGIHIFNAKEKILVLPKASSTGTCTLIISQNTCASSF